MAADNLLSRTITNLDGSLTSSPIAIAPAYDTAGFNIAAEVVQTSDYCGATTTGLATTSSTYKLVRLPSRANVKSMKLFADAVMDSYGTPTLAWNVGAYYSDSTIDGTQPSLQGTLISTSCFFASTAAPTATGLAGAITTSKIGPINMDQMLWDFLGLASDPGGFIDVVAAVEAVAHTAVAGNIGVIVDYAAP
jgi:hypothetical protein